MWRQVTPPDGFHSLFLNPKKYVLTVYVFCIFIEHREHNINFLYYAYSLLSITACFLLYYLIILQMLFLIHELGVSFRKYVITRPLDGYYCLLEYTFRKRMKQILNSIIRLHVHLLTANTRIHR